MTTALYPIERTGGRGGAPAQAPPLLIDASLALRRPTQEDLTITPVHYP